MKFAEPRLLANPDVAARKIVELANAIETIQDVASISRRSMARFYIS
jgi:hypothetical protein